MAMPPLPCLSLSVSGPIVCGFGILYVIYKGVVSTHINSYKSPSLSADARRRYVRSFNRGGTGRWKEEEEKDDLGDRAAAPGRDPSELVDGGVPSPTAGH